MVKRALLAVLLTAAAISLAQSEALAQADSFSVPAGTLLYCRTTQTLTTKLNSAGDTFTFRVTQPVSLNGHVAIPVDSTLTGRITFLERPGRIKGVGQMRLTVDRIALPQGRSYPLAAALMAAYGIPHVKVIGGEGLIMGPSSRVPDLEEIGAGTAGGTLLGLIFAHPVVGATLGLTATAIDRLRRRGKDLTIPFGTDLSFELTRQLAVNNDGISTTAENEVHSTAP